MNRISRLAAAFALVALVVLAWSGSFHAGFHLDDSHQIVDNASIRTLDNAAKFFTDISTGSFFTENRGYRPLTVMSFAASYFFSGYDVFGWHVFNLLLHLLNAFLIYLITARLCALDGKPGGLAASLFAASAFALHPLQTGAVTYISGRAVLLASFFGLSSFYCFLRYRELRPRRILYGALSLPLLLLGLLSKEMVVCVPGLMLAYDLIFTARGAAGPKGRSRQFVYYLPVVLVIVSYLAIKNAMQGYTAIGQAAYGVVGYMVSEAKVLPMYMRLVLLPVNQNFDYRLPAMGQFDLRLLLSVLLVVAVLAALYRLSGRSPAAAFFGFWFFVALAPESTLFPIEDLAVEYRLYLPSAGLIASLALLAREHVRPPGLMKRSAAAVLLLLGLLTNNRNAVFATERTLWADVVKKAPYSERAHANLGYALIHEKRYAEAENELKLSLAIAPDSPKRMDVFNNLGVCYMETGRLNEAVIMFEEAIALYPGFKEAHANLGYAYFLKGMYGESVETLRAAASRYPGYYLYHYYLSKSFTMLGKNDEALKEMRETVRLLPDDFGMSYELAIAYLRAGMPRDALNQAVVASRLAGDQAQAQEIAGFIARLQKINNF